MSARRMIAATLAFAAAHLGAPVQAQPMASYDLLDPLHLPSLLGATSARDWRLETALNLDSRQQVRLSAAPPAYRLPTSGLNYDPARATYRYTVLERETWAWRVGLTANLHPSAPSMAAASGAGALNRSTDGIRFAHLPLLHMAGEARLAPRWLLGIDADGLLTPRGRTLELGLQVRYLLAPNLSLFGGYRLSGAGGEAEEAYGSGVSNAANVGVRLRF